jgi:Tol biopolymer transport system component
MAPATASSPIPRTGDISVGPVFSPDGTRIVFSSYHPEINGGQEDPWTINVDGTDLTRLTSPLDGYAPGENDPVWGAAP